MRQYRRFDSINVIPLVDILLVLLVVVITTSTFVKEESLPIDLPTASSSTAIDSDKVELEIQITSKNLFLVDNQQMGLLELEELLKTLPKDRAIVLRGDKDASLSSFIDIIDLLKTYNLSELYILTKGDN